MKTFVHRAPSAQIPLRPSSPPSTPSADRATQWAFNFYVAMIVAAILYFILLPLFL